MRKILKTKSNSKFGMNSGLTIKQTDGKKKTPENIGFIYSLGPMTPIEEEKCKIQERVIILF